MNAQRLFLAALPVACSFSILAAAQQSATTDPQAAQADAETHTAHVDARADARVKAMSDYLAKLQSFSFTVDIMYDAVEDDGQKLQLGRVSAVEIRRPQYLRAESKGDRGVHQISVFDGKNFIVHDATQKVFSRIEANGALPELFATLFEKYGVSPPLVDFLLPDVHAALTENANSGGILGDATVAGKECEHLTFSGDSIDWQVWIEKGDHPFPRKFVITYKDVDVRPQFIAVFREWNGSASHADSRFVTTPPADAREVPMDVPAAQSRTESADDKKNNDQQGD
ncbi:MAG: DUF2092 domain-containing protein [Phycisphaerae bacterium]